MKRNLATGLVIGLSVTSLLCAVIPSRAQVPAIIGDTAPEIKFEKLLEAPPEADTPPMASFCLDEVGVRAGGVKAH